MNIDKILRELAKSNYWQTIYSQAKEIGLKIFNNTTNLTCVQIKFLNYLSFYQSLFLDIYLGEVSEDVLQNFIYEDSYSLFKKQKNSKFSQDTENNIKKFIPNQEVKNDQKSLGIHWNFKK